MTRKKVGRRESSGERVIQNRVSAELGEPSSAPERHDSRQAAAANPAARLYCEECGYTDHHERIRALEAELESYRDSDAPKMEPGWSYCVKHDAVFKQYCAGCENEVVLRKRAEARVKEHHSGGYPSICSDCDWSKGRKAREREED